jgi:hypothetical protein
MLEVVLATLKKPKIEVVLPVHHEHQLPFLVIEV